MERELDTLIGRRSEMPQERATSGRDRLTGKYYFQNDPTFAPFAISQVGNFPQQLSAGSHLVSIQNTTTVTPNSVWTQGFGFIREKAFAHTIDGYTNGDYGLNIFGLSNVPGITIGQADPNTGGGLGIPDAGLAAVGVHRRRGRADLQAA